MIALTGTPLLQTARLTLRAPAAADWPRWMAFMASDRSRFAGGPLTEARGWRAFGHVIGHWLLRGYGSFVVTLRGSDAGIGMAGPYHPIDWPEPEIGWVLWRGDDEAKGYAFEAAEAARAYAFTTLGWKTAVSYIDPANSRSITLARRLGATLDAAAPRPDADDLVFRHPNPRGGRRMIQLTGTPVLETSRLTLRVPDMRDWEGFAAFLTSDRAALVGGPVTRERAWRAFGHLVGHWVLRGYGMFAVALNAIDAAIGMAGPWFPESWPEQELGWSMWSAAAEGQGYAFEAAEAARAYAFGTLGWKTAVSYIDPANSRSIALARRLGATPDPAAACPGDQPCLVFRHPKPEAAA